MTNLNEYKIEVDRSRDYGVFENLSEAQTFQQFLEAKKAAVKEDEGADGDEGKENEDGADKDDDAKEGKEKVDEDGEGNEE